MKKGLLFLAILFSLLAVSCSDDDDDTQNQYAKYIIGNWEGDSGGQYSIYYSFREDNTGVMYYCIPNQGQAATLYTVKNISHYSIDLNIPVSNSDKPAFGGVDKINRITLIDTDNKTVVLYFHNLYETSMQTTQGFYKKVDKLNIVGL